MVRTIMRKEFTDRLRDARFRVSAVLVFVLLGTALLVGFQQRQTYERQRAEAAASERAAWVNQGESNPHSAAHFGRYAFKPLLPTALVDSGVTNQLGVAVYIEGHAQNPFRYRPAEDATGLQAFGELTAAAVLQLLLPLVIILLTFNAFSGERESGTLKQVLSLGVEPMRLFWGKAAGSVLGLVVLVVPAALIGVYLLAAGVAHEGDATLARFAAMSAAYLVYLGGFVAMALAVSAVTSSSRLSLLVLMGVWIVSSLLVPRAAASLAEAWHPTPSLEAFLRQMQIDQQEGLDGHEPPGAREAEVKRALLQRYGVQSEAELPLNLTGYMLQQSEEHGNVVFDRRFGELREIYLRQQSVMHAAALISPLLAVRSVSMAVAGTDLWQHQSFADAAEQYRRTWVKRLNDDLTYNSRTGDATYRVGRAFWEATNDFQYQVPTLRDTSKRLAGPAALLAGWCVCASLVAVVAIGRMRVVEDGAR